MLLSIFDPFTQAIRRFEYDYIFIDSIFLTFWIALLIKYKKWNPLKFGVITGLLVYFIDAVVWFNVPVNSNYPPGTFIREYWIGGIYMPRPLGNYFWAKFGADFMMTISYALFAFGWLWIMFENFTKKKSKEIILFTLVFFASWLLVPFLSFWIPLNDTLVYSVRYMDTQIVIWIVNFLVGYFVLYLIYGTNKFGSKNSKIILYVFMIGCTGAFFMEFPLLISGIRPTGILFLIYDTILMFNQGAPYLYIAYDKVLPWLFVRIKRKTRNEMNITKSN